MAANDPNEDVSRLLKDVNELDAAQFYPAILSAFDVFTEPNELQVFLKAVVAAYVRHVVIGRLESSLIEDFAFCLAKRLRENNEIQAVLMDLKAFAPDDTSFMDAFQRAAISRTATARYILRELEHKQRQTEELEVSTPSRVHVEHIYPQTPLPTHRWSNHAQFINRLGNLTLLSRRLNVTIRNAAFDVKRLSYAQSEILITKTLENYREWDVSSIERRQNAMGEAACEIWAMPSMVET